MTFRPARRASLRLFALTLTTTLAAQVPANAWAQSTPKEGAGASEDARKEAASRFERGLDLFDRGNPSAALAEFKRAYELVPSALVLYNIALVHAASNAPVEALDALDKLVANPGTLSKEGLARATKLRDEQSLNVAEITVEVAAEGAVVEVDNVEVARTPLKAPIRVSGGSHVVGVVAQGYAPARKQITTPGASKMTMKFDLVPLQGRIAHLAVKSRLPGADVVVDSQVVGKTPLSTSLSIVPGKHTVELRRAGYSTAKQELDLGDGATGEVTLEPQEEASAIAREGVRLTLEISEPEALVTIDGTSRGLYAQSFMLAKGPHTLLVQRADFEPFEREIVVAGSSTNVKVDLVPTPEKREAYVSNARLHRTLGIVGIGAGAAVAAGSVVFLVVNGGSKSDAQAAYDEIVKQSIAGSGERCDPRSQQPDDCVPTLDSRKKDLDAAKSRDVIGYVGAGIGGALVVAGIVVLATGGDPHKYDRDGAKANAAKGGITWTPTGWFSATGGGGGLVGAF
ncbi:MAG: PEGA domain-containing protein [Polyangiaceae bacterium]